MKKQEIKSVSTPQSAGEIRAARIQKDLWYVLWAIQRQAEKGKSTCSIAVYFKDNTRADVMFELQKLGWKVDKKGWVKW